MAKAINLNKVNDSVTHKGGLIHVVAQDDVNIKRTYQLVGAGGLIFLCGSTNGGSHVMDINSSLPAGTYKLIIKDLK
jgi:hypothetical protein